MANVDGIVFRESFKGFNKADVIKYIEEQNQRFSDQEEVYLSEIASRDRRIEELEKRPEPSDGSDAVITSLNDQLDKAKEENNELIRKLAEADARISELTESIKGNSELAEKAELYDKMSIQLGSIMIYAKNDADEMLANANEASEKLIGDTKLRTGAAICEAKDQLGKMTEEYIQNITKCVFRSLDRVNEIGVSINAAETKAPKGEPSKPDKTIAPTEARNAESRNIDRNIDKRKQI